MREGGKRVIKYGWTAEGVSLTSLKVLGGWQHRITDPFWELGVGGSLKAGGGGAVSGD